MVTVLNDPSGINEAFSELFSSINRDLDVRNQRLYTEKQQQQQRDREKGWGTILSQTLGQLPADATQMQRAQAAAQAMERGVPLNYITGFGQAYKSFEGPRSTSGGGNAPSGFENEENLEEVFQSYGMDPETAIRSAKFYRNLPVGGKTQFIKYFMEQVSRGGFGQGQRKNIPTRNQTFEERVGGLGNEPLYDQADEESILAQAMGIDQQQFLPDFEKSSQPPQDILAQISGISQQRSPEDMNLFPPSPGRRQPSDTVDVKAPNAPSKDLSAVDTEEVVDFQFPDISLFKGLTPKEKVSREDDLYKTNLPQYDKFVEKAEKHDKDLRSYEQISKINDRGNLPEGLGRFNVNWSSGELTLPWVSHPDAQLFIKMISDFTTNIKESYGAQITDFDIRTFMRRLPSLNNSQEGRNLVLQQLKINGALDKLYADSLKTVYDHYGLRGIDRQEAQKIAENLRKDDEQKLKNDYANILEEQDIFVAKANAPEGKIAGRDPKGKIVYFDENKAELAKRKGYTIL